MRSKTWIIGVVFGVMMLSHANAQVVMPSVISDNMVLQQNTTVNIWGKASVGEVVKLTVSWSEKTHVAAAGSDGKWSVKVKTPSSITGQTIRIEASNVVDISNILIGEVWLCSGQSNMDFPVAKKGGWRTGMTDEQQQMKDADYPQIRLFHIAQKLSPEQELDDCEGEWVVCSAENIADFSAVAFVFGKELHKNLKTPIGLIQATWGATHAESWTKMSAMEGDEVYSELLKDFYRSRDNYPADMRAYQEAMLVFDGEKAAGNMEVKAPKKPAGIMHNKALSTLWNGMINPIVPYAIKGVIWYQGESNSIRHGDYTHVFNNMITSWRTEWGRGDFPFYFVQIAPHYKQPPQIREAQLRSWQSVKNTGMVVITDVGDSTDIHPRNKTVPGVRLANWALAKDYGKGVRYSGPLYKSMKIKDNRATLSFDYAHDGLNPNADVINGFVVAGSDHKFYPAKAVAKGDKIEVSAPEVSTPVAVRYGWGKFFRVNLYNGAGLPASPFRTDNWTE